MPTRCLHSTIQTLASYIHFFFFYWVSDPSGQVPRHRCNVKSINTKKWAHVEPYLTRATANIHKVQSQSRIQPPSYNRMLLRPAKTQPKMKMKILRKETQYQRGYAKWKKLHEKERRKKETKCTPKKNIKQAGGRKKLLKIGMQRSIDA